MQLAADGCGLPGKACTCTARRGVQAGTGRSCRCSKRLRLVGCCCWPVWALLLAVLAPACSEAGVLPQLCWPSSVLKGQAGGPDRDPLAHSCCELLQEHAPVSAAMVLLQGLLLPLL